MDEPSWSPATVAAQGVRAPAPSEARPHSEPLYQTSVFDFPSLEASIGPLAGEGGYAYARTTGTPNARTLELTVAALEGAADALATSSGMAALAMALLACARAGERVAVQADAYGGTLALARQDFARFGIAVDEVDVAAPALAPGTRALLVETLSNPLLREADLPSLAAHCRGRGARLVVDNTFATPCFRRPLALGADLVVHSATKFLGGHHDLTAGVVAGDAALVAEARGLARRLGCTVAPLDAWLAARGIRTLDVRLERAQANARALDEKLRADPRVAKVMYPGWGAMLSFDVGDRARASELVRRLRLVTLTPSLGGTTTGISHSATSSHRSLAPEARARLGIGEGLLRLSVGIEAWGDLWRDLDGALAR